MLFDRDLKNQSIFSLLIGSFFRMSFRILKTKNYPTFAAFGIKT